MAAAMFGCADRFGRERSADRGPSAAAMKTKAKSAHQRRLGALRARRGCFTGTAEVVPHRSTSSCVRARGRCILSAQDGSRPRGRTLPERATIVIEPARGPVAERHLVNPLELIISGCRDADRSNSPVPRIQRSTARCPARMVENSNVASSRPSSRSTTAATWKFFWRCWGGGSRAGSTSVSSEATGMPPAAQTLVLLTCRRRLELRLVRPPG